MKKENPKEGEIFNPYKVFHGIHIPNSICKLTTITACTKLIWGRLIQYAGKNGFCYPKQKTLANELGISLMTVVRGLKELKDNKFIIITPPTGKDLLMHKNNRYEFLWHECMNKKNTPTYNRKVNSTDNKKVHLTNNQKDTPNKIYSLDQIDSCVSSLNKETFKELTLSNFDGAKLLRKGSLKKRSKILLQNTPLQNTPLLRERFSKETLSPKIPVKKAKEVFISKDVKSIIDYWTENKLRMPKKETKSYRNCVIKTRDLLLGKLFLKDKRYSIEEIKSSIDNFTQAVYNPDIEPIAPDKKKKLKSLSIGDFIFSFQGYSYFKEYLNKKPSKVIEDKFPSMTKALKRLYSEDVFGTTHKAFDFEEENYFRRASMRLKKFLNDNNKNWSNMMIPVGDYEEARLLWESIKSSLNGADDFSKVTPSWLISNHTFNHRLPAFLYHQGYLLEDIEIRKEKTRTFSDRDIMRMQDQEERRSEIEYTRYLLGY